MSEGLQEIKSLREAGFGDSEIQEYELSTRQELTDAGFGPQEVDEYFGKKEPDMTGVKKHFEDTIKNVQASRVEKGQPEEADSFLEYLEAGWDQSSTGLLVNGEMPDMVLPEDAGRMARIASQVSSIAGDVPAMIAGAFAGGAAGAAAGTSVPVIGTAAGGTLGAGFGGNALPAAIKETLMQSYEKGEVQDFGDFFERASAVFLETTKQGIIGAVTVGVGGKVLKGAAKVASPVMARGASATAELATMVTMGKAFEGQVPTADDFIDGGLLLAGLTGSMKVAGKMRKTYVESNLKPHELVDLTVEHPSMMGDLLSENIDTPRALSATKQLKEGAALTPKEVPAATVDPDVPKTSTQKILDQVGTQEEVVKPGYTAKKFYQDFVDKFDPIKVAEKQLSPDKVLDTADSPYQLTRMVNDYKAKVKHVFERGPLEFDTLATKGKSLKDIVEPFKENLEDFSAFLISKRALEIEGRGIKSGFDLEAAADVVGKADPKFIEAAKDLVDFQNNNLKYLKDSGVIDDVAFDSMVKMGESYIPFSRLIEQEGGGSGKSNPLKALKGSDKKIQNPFLSILENTETIYKMAEQNRAKVSFVKLVEKSGDSSLMEKVPGQMKAIKVNSSEVAKFFAEHGIEADAEAFTIFRGQTKKAGPLEFEVFRNGKKEVYKTTPELAEAFQALDGDAAGTNVFLKLAKGITTVKKFGISMTPDFIVKNLFRDQLTAGVFSKGGTLPFTDIVSAMGDIVGKNDVYYNWMKSGGAGGAFLELNQTYLDGQVFKLDQETKFIDKAWNTVKKPVEIMGIMGSLAEQGTRLAEFKRVSKGAASGPDVMAGGFASREVTVDFQRVGAKMSALNAITAFQNVSIQGLDRTVRAFKENPLGVAGKSALYLTTPSILLWWANKDDPRYQEIPRWQKDLFWIVPTDSWQKAENGEEEGLPAHLVRQGENGAEVNKGIIFRIPKPQELGVVFASVPERIMESFFTENPKAFSDFQDTMTELVSPSFIPDAVAPVMEQAVNKSFFTGNPIVSPHMEKLLPEYQYNEYTSATAKSVSKLISNIPVVREFGPDDAKMASPAVIDNYIRSWTGSLGQYAIKTLDAGLKGVGIAESNIDPASTIADMPIIKAFVIRHPSASQQSIQDFYSEYKKNEKVFATIKELAKRGDLNNMESVMNLRENRERMVKLESTKEALGTMTQAIHMVNQSKDMTPDDKRQLIDKLYYGMAMAAKNSLKVMESVKTEIARQEQGKR